MDVPLLEALTVRLLSGQVDNGAWMYDTDKIPDGEEKRLEAYYNQAKEKKPDPPRQPRTVRDLAPELQQRLLQIRLRPGTVFAPVDHSNTQFATLALWVGRPHAEYRWMAALALIDRHYRATQNADGGWGYHIIAKSAEAATTASMTCSAILGLSVAHGMAVMNGKPLDANARPAFDPMRDATLRKAIARLTMFIDQPPSVKKMPAPRLVGKDIYFLWSLERIMVVLKVDRLGGKPWYQWGSELLVANQQGDGRWAAEFGANGADTCFALLFLNRANLAKDLTIKINKLELIDEDKPKKWSALIGSAAKFRDIHSSFRNLLDRFGGA